MLILATTGSTILLVTGSAGSIDVHCDYVDYTTTGTATPGTQNTAITTIGSTTIVTAPGASTYRNVKTINVRNKHATNSNLVTVEHNDGTTTVELVKYTLLAGEQLQYSDTRGWVVLDAGGGLKTAAAPGRLLKITSLTSGTTFTTSPSTTSIRVRMQAGGGQGGGCTVGSASISGAAGGGAAGGYAEKLFAVTPNTAYTYAIGAGGSTSGTGAITGQAGGNTTFTVGGVTVTANGGLGGIGCTSAATVLTLGGAAPAVSTNGDINASGTPGEYGVVASVGNAISGSGGSSEFGGGGNSLKTQGTGAAANGNGAGGGGGCTISTTGAVAGGAGSAGIIIVEEYS